MPRFARVNDCDAVSPQPCVGASFSGGQVNDVNHPTHYCSHPSGIECIEITEHMNFCLGNAFKYIWRAGLKSDDALKDLKKAQWYIEREIARLENNAKPTLPRIWECKSKRCQYPDCMTDAGCRNNYE